MAADVHLEADDKSDLVGGLHDGDGGPDGQLRPLLRIKTLQRGVAGQVRDPPFELIK
jgi:hypothetical protein